MKTFYLIISLLMGFLLPVFSQNQSKIDSLQQNAVAASDSAKIGIYTSLCWELRAGNSVLALEYAEKALFLSDSLKINSYKPTIYAFSGVAKRNQGDYGAALSDYLKSLEFSKELNNETQQAYSLNNIGEIYILQGNHTQAKDYIQRAIASFKRIDEKRGLAYAYNQMGRVYRSLDEYDNSLKYNFLALKIRRISKNSDAIAASLNNIGEILLLQAKYDEALKYLLESLQHTIAIGAQAKTASAYNLLANLYLRKSNYKKSDYYFQKALEIGEKIKMPLVVKFAAKGLSQLYKIQGKYARAFDYLELFKQMSDSLTNLENTRKLTQARLQHEFAEKQKEMEFEKKERELAHNEQVKRQKQFLQFAIAGGIFIAILALVLLRGFLHKKRVNKIITAEKKKSDELLLNTLPAKIVEDLKVFGKTEPENFENVTVYFSDVVGFTNLSTGLDPKFLIEELSDIFTAFDDIMMKNSCERIKTIGDAYLAVCGMPEANPQHAELMVKSAIEIVDYLKKRNQNSQIEWKIRVGIHTGKVVGGVVGVRKYIYDVFGDTINTASRMESNSEPMRINVSHITHDLLKNKFQFTERGTMEVKGKGKMDMFFVDGYLDKKTAN